MIPDPLKTYRHTHIKTASQGKLIVMLYDEFLKQLNFAKSELIGSAPKLDSVHNAIVKGQDIITELMASLDFEKGGEIANNLFHLYMFFNQRLMEANISKDSKALSEIQHLMAELREAWVTIEGKVDVKEGNISNGINLAG